MKIAVLAAEVSGDLLGADLIKTLRQINPEISCAGVGGTRMEVQGVDSWVDIRALSVQGYVEVIKKLPGLVKVRHHILANLRRFAPDVIVGIDAPDLFLSIERRFKKRCRVYHYVSPSVWAWRAQRIPGIGRSADHIFCLFPHEPDLYRAKSVPASFVGHPLVRMIPKTFDRDEWCEKFSLPKDAPVFALLPGSRLQEINVMAPLMLQVAEIIKHENPEAYFFVPFVSRASMECFGRIQERMHFAHLPIP